MAYLEKLTGIKSLDTKQCLARLSPPPVKLTSFVGGKFPPPLSLSPPPFQKKRRESFMIVAYLCVCKSKDLYNLRYKSNKCK